MGWAGHIDEEAGFKVQPSRMDEDNYTVQQGWHRGHTAVVQDMLQSLNTRPGGRACVRAI